MAENNVSQPPLTTPIVDPSGKPSKAWAIWFRDVYRRIGYKGGNAIDENQEEINEALIGVGSTLEQVIAQVVINVNGINQNAAGVSQNAENLSQHEQLEEAHGSNGNIVGFNDLADETTVGLVKRMAEIADAVDSTVDITTPDILAAPATYNQAYIQTIADLTNENKAAINQLASDLNSAIGVLNNLLAQSKSSGQMTAP